MSYLRSQLSVNNSVFNQQHGLIIYPPKLEFLNVVQNQSSPSVISIQNVSKTLKKIRIIGVPEKHKSLFTVHATKTYHNLASGCSMDIPITFLSKSALTQSIYTELRIGIRDRMKEGPLNIQIIAQIPSSNIEFESILDFESVIPNQSITKRLRLKNLGPKTGHYQFEVPAPYKSQISIQPSMEGALDSDQCMNMQITLNTPDKLGIFRCSIDVIIDKDKNNMKPLEVLCNVCQNKINFLMPKTKSSIEEIHFGHLYFGQTRTLKGLLINESPKSAHYSLYLKPYKERKEIDLNNDNTHVSNNKRDTDGEADADEDIPFDEDSVPITIDHEEGTLPPYGSQMICVTYSPVMQEKLKGFVHNYDPKGEISEMKLLLVIESTQSIQIPLNGISCPVLYRVSQSTFDFGECPVYDRRDIYFELKNENKWMSLPYKLNKVACFNTSPSMGTLLPLQSVNVLLTFCPKQLGKFNQVKIGLVFNDHMQSVDHLMVSGSAVTGSNTPLVGGIDKLPIDFKPNIKIINDKKLITAIMKETANLPFQTQMPNERSAYYKPGWNNSISIPCKQQNVSQIHAAQESQPNLHYTYSTMDRIQRYTNKQKSNQYLVTQRRLKTKQRRKKKETNSNVIGLNEPQLELPPVEDTLYLGDGQRIDTQADRLSFFKKCMVSKYNKKGSITKMDENKLIRDKFKSVPETSAEIIDCQTSLTRKELKELQFGPKCMDFGKICIHSKSSKNFSFINTLKKTILVEVKNDFSWIVAHPLSQVIPSQQMAGFDIILNAVDINIGALNEDITLLINGIHTISFKLNAEIICMDLRLSMDKLKFEFPAVDYLDFSLVKNITLSNVLSAPAKYRFDAHSVPTKDITIKPLSGIIQPNKSQSVQFIWSPTSHTSHDTGTNTDRYHIKLQIVDGYDKSIEIESVLPLSKCTLSNKMIDFNTIAIGTEHTKRVHIKNTGQIQSIFRIIHCPSNLSIHPLYGKVDIGTSFSLSVTYLSLTPQTFNENIMIEVRGGKTLKLNVIAQTVIPLLDVTQTEFDFGGVTIGDTKSLAMELVNTSAVPANLFLEMTANDLYPNGTFDIVYPNEWNDLAAEPTKAPIIPLPSLEEDELHDQVQFDIPQSHETVSVRIVRSLDNPNLLNDNPQQHSSQASLKLTADKSRKGLHSPMMRRGSLLAMGQHLTMMQEVEEDKKDADANSRAKDDDEEVKELIRYRILVDTNATLRFKLSFHPKEVGQYDFDLNLTMAGVTSWISTAVHGGGLKPRIALSTRNVSFFDVTVLSEYEKHIMIHNEENNTIKWKLVNQNGQNASVSPWKIIPDHGVLQPLGTCKVAIGFNPVSDALFRSNIELTADNVALSIELEGQASYPKLSFNEEFLLLPTVALNCKSSKLCVIKNHGYENLEIRYEIIDDKAASYMHLHFPNGRIIGGNGPDELKVEISLLSSVSVSVTTRIDFIDMDSNRFSIFVSGMADNCILTNQPFLYNNDYVIGSNLKVFHCKSKMKECNLIPDDIPTNILCDVSVLIRYLEANCYLKFDSNIDNFPSDLVSSNGEMMIDLVQFLSGKKMPHKAVKQKTDTQVERLINNYAQLINFLKAHGALITIRPEYLLSCTQYIKFIQISATMSSQPPSSTKNKFNELKSSKSHSDMQKLKKQAEMVHPMISYVSWTQLLFQIVKLFILNQITFQSFIKQGDIAKLIQNDDPFILKCISNQNEDEESKPEQSELNEDHLASLPTSNVYSVHENILLVWVSVHFNKMSAVGSNERFFKTFSQLSDGVAIIHLLQSYAPHITELERVRTRTPLTDDDRRHNASLIIQSMKRMGLNIAITCDDITKPIERNLCLLILYLYQHLPEYAENNKKNIITFNGNLNEEIVAKIHVANPSKTTKICYEIIMSGDAGFELKTSSFIVLAPFGKKQKLKKTQSQNSQISSARSSLLEAEAEADIIISYTPRFIRPSSARLTLLAKPFPDAIFPCKVPQTMSFELKSSLIESKPIKTIECKGRLYESSKVCFEVKNPYSTNCEFNVIIKNMSDTETDASHPSRSIPSPWHYDKKTIKIKGKSSVEFGMQYLPFNMGKHVCCITFMDHRYGEFLYHIIGESLLPQATDCIELKCKDTESISHEINFNSLFKNPLLSKACHIAADRSRNTKEELESLQSLQSNPCVYDVHVSSPFFVSPKQLKLYDDKEADNRLSITFNPKGPGSYPCTIKLESHNDASNIGDIRIYTMQVTAQSQGTHAELEFNAHANEKVIQKIPIVNSTTSEWRITSQIIGDAAIDFDTTKQKDFTVSSNTTGNYNLIYAPQWISSNVTAQLILNNQATGEAYIYDLSCTSKEPLAKDHIVLECQAKSSIDYEFEIENPYYPSQSVEYKIESDLTLSTLLSGDASITIASSQKSSKYKLSITPQCGGNIHGSVSFIESNQKRFVWYSMELICSSPEPEKIIKISAYLRQVVAIEINVSNPLTETIEFDISISGEGLFGDNRLVLLPSAQSIYKLHYSPLVTGEVKGSISFSNEVSGEFWYSLVLIGKKPPSIQLADMICSVGNVCSQQISVENPFDEVIVLKKDENIMIKDKDDSSCFYLRNGKSIITIPPVCIHPITLVYRPSLIGVKQSCDIIFKHHKLGEWNYNVTGLGKEPNIEKHTFIYALLHSRVSKVISFQNPFQNPLKIKIELESNCANDIFQLFMKKKKKQVINVTPNSSLQIPIFFSPNAMRKYDANLVITTTNNQNKRELVWNYPIVALSEYKSSQLLNIKCNARQTFHKVWSLELDNYYRLSDGDEDEFKIEIQNKNQIIENSLTIDLIKKKLSKKNSNSLQIEVMFEPLRALNESAILHIINKLGVRWIFQLNFVVNKAEVDDVITIQSQLHNTSSVCFGLDLFSPSPSAATLPITFRAYFTPTSPFEFDVDPKTGVVENEEASTQQFVVSFTPNEYGAALNGTLIIETPIMEWSYRVIGTHPTYVPPNLNKFKPTVDDKISKQIQFKRQKEKNIIKNTNFLKRNITATKK